MSYSDDIRMHAQEIKKLRAPTRNMVIDALRVRSMDFVTDRLHSDAGDETADVIRELVPHADDSNVFSADDYQEGVYA